jgi:DNA-binding transcriptional MerR regulator
VSERRLTVGNAAKLVGVSVRTLHHYDEIGLVVPSGRTSTGYRIYEPGNIERLYQVLTYRELGFALEEIRKLLDDPDIDVLEHLKDQLGLLGERIDRLRQMASAVEKMMEAKKVGIQLTPEEQREIFGDDWRGDEYAEEAEQRWGNTESWKQSQERVAHWSKDDWVRVKADTDALEADFAAALGRGVAAGSAEANALAERHRAGIEQYYDCDHQKQVCLAEMYVADERFRKHYDDQAAGLAQFVHDIIVANAGSKTP